MMKKWLRFFSLVLCIFICTACGQNNQNGTENKGYTVTDSRGKTVHMREKPQRIISTYIFADEILLDLVSPDRIVGMDKWIHDPGLSMASEKARNIKIEVGDSAEQIVSLRPDLVIMNASQTKLISSLESVGISVFVYKDAKRIKDIPEEIRMVGAAVGEKEQAEQMISHMEAKLRSIKEKVEQIPQNQRKRTMLVLRFGPIGGKGTIFNDVLTHAGAIDAYDEVRPHYFADQGANMILSKEEFIKSDPDVILMGNWSQGGAYKDSYQQLESMYASSAYSSMKAIRKQQVFVIPQRNVNCLSQHVAEGIEMVYKVLYEGKEVKS